MVMIMIIKRIIIIIIIIIITSPSSSSSSSSSSSGTDYHDLSVHANGADADDLDVDGESDVIKSAHAFATISLGTCR